MSIYYIQNDNTTCNEELVWCNSTTSMANHLLKKHKIDINSMEEFETPSKNIKDLLANKYPYHEESKQYKERLLIHYLILELIPIHQDVLQKLRRMFKIFMKRL